MFRTFGLLSISLLLIQCWNNDLANAATIQNNDDKGSKSSLSSIFVDDVVVESTLSVRRKSGTRQGRTGTGLTLETTNSAALPRKIDGSTLLKLQRSKRQNRRKPYYGNFPQQQQFPQQFPQQFGQFPQFQPIRGSASNAAAQAQGFQSNSPFGNFGASAANAGSQGFSYDEGGIRGNAGLSGSQSYNLPNGNTLAISYANGFSVGPDGRPTVTKGNSIAFTGSDGKPVPGFAYDPNQ